MTGDRPGHEIYSSTTETKYWCSCGHVFFATKDADLKAEYDRH